MVQEDTHSPREAAIAAASALSGEQIARKISQLQAQIGRAFQGKERVVQLTLATMLARGHILLEDVPGVGKTTLALALARCLGLDFRRVQFTSDMLPSDILGVSVWSQSTGEFLFTPGPIFSQLVLADEINRTTPRTQSALLEAMSEGRVSVDNITHTLPAPFHVIATQNPLESYGTYPLPESQLDRFLMRLSIGYPGPEIERLLLQERTGVEPVDTLDAVVSQAEFAALQERAANVTLKQSVADYIMALVLRTRQDERVKVGVSTRGALALARASRAYALVQGRDFCVPDDVREVFVPCCAHRLSLGAGMKSATREEVEALVDDMARQVKIPT